MTQGVSMEARRPHYAVAPSGDRMVPWKVVFRFGATNSEDVGFYRSTEGAQAAAGAYQDSLESIFGTTPQHITEGVQLHA